MNTLNTIIEEEEKTADRAVDAFIDREISPNAGRKEVKDEIVEMIQLILTTAMQRAYEAGREEHDTYWKERVGEIRLLIAKYAKSEDMDTVGLVNEINTLCK